MSYIHILLNFDGWWFSFNWFDAYDLILDFIFKFKFVIPFFYCSARIILSFILNWGVLDNFHYWNCRRNNDIILVAVNLNLIQYSSFLFLFNLLFFYFLLIQFFLTKKLINMYYLILIIN